MEQYVVNPKTGKPILKGGVTHKKLFNSGDITEALPPPKRRVLTPEQKEVSKQSLQKAREASRVKRELNKSQAVKDISPEKSEPIDIPQVKTTI